MGMATYCTGRSAHLVRRLATAAIVGALLCVLPVERFGALQTLRGAAAQTVVGHVITVRASSARDPRYGAMRDGYTSLTYLWRERGTSFVGLFADGTHETIGSGLPAGVSVSSLRRGIQDRVAQNFAVGVVATGGRVLFTSRNTVDRARLMRIVMNDPTATPAAPRNVALDTSASRTDRSMISRSSSVPTPRMRPLATDSMVTRAVPTIEPTATRRAVAPVPLFVDPMATGSVARSGRIDVPASMLPTLSALLSWEREQVVDQQTTSAISPLPTQSPPPEPAKVLVVREVEIAPSKLAMWDDFSRERQRNLDTALSRSRLTDGFEGSLLAPPGIVELARLRFAGGRAIEGPRDRLVASNACDLQVAPAAWIAFVAEHAGLPVRHVAYVSSTR